MSSITAKDKVLTAFEELLAAALWERECPELPAMNSEEWEQLYQMSKSQTVSAIVFDAVKCLPKGSGLEMKSAARWLFDVNAIENASRKMQDSVASMQVLWQKIEVEPVVLKGLEAAKLYPVPEHRMCGDVDWYFRLKGDLDRAERKLEDAGIELHRDSDGDLHYIYRGQLMEHHYLRFDPEDRVQLLCMYSEHILKHAMVFGVGMRQICDLALAYKAYAGSYDAACLGRLLERRRTTHWTALIHAFIVRVLKMDPELLPALENSDWTTVPEKDVDRLLKLVMNDGNFGFSKKFRIKGFFPRVMLFLRYAPYRFLHRWNSLLLGRLHLKKVRNA